MILWIKTIRPSPSQLSVAATPVQCDGDDNICFRFSQEKLEIVKLDNDKLVVCNLDITFKHVKKAPKVYGRWNNMDVQDVNLFVNDTIVSFVTEKMNK